METIDVNCDMGESYGPWRLGDDEAVMPFVTSVNVAAGFHAGDPTTIRRTVAAAARHGLAVGAHVGLPDRLGFGRRVMEVAPDELRDYVAYQVGAVRALAAAEGAAITHVKPHGALYAMCLADAGVAGAVAAAIAELDVALPVLLAEDPGGVLAAAGIRVVPEGFPDLHYTPDGRMIVERHKAQWDPDVVAARAVRMAVEGRVSAQSGEEVELRVRTLCLHGDAANAPSIAAAVRRGLEAAGVGVRPFAISTEHPEQEENE